MEKLSVSKNYLELLLSLDQALASVLPCLLAEKVTNIKLNRRNKCTYCLLNTIIQVQFCFKTGPLQCLRDVPQRQMFLSII